MASNILKFCVWHKFSRSLCLSKCRWFGYDGDVAQYHSNMRGVCVSLSIRWWRPIFLCQWRTSCSGPWTFSEKIYSAGFRNMEDGYVRLSFLPFFFSECLLLLQNHRVHCCCNPSIWGHGAAFNHQTLCHILSTPMFAAFKWLCFFVALFTDVQTSQIPVVNGS